MKHTILMGLVLLFSIPLQGQHNYREWQAQTNAIYEHWQKEQDWKNSYIDWSKASTTSYNQWLEASGFESEEAFDQSFFNNDSLGTDFSNTTNQFINTGLNDSNLQDPFFGSNKPLLDSLQTQITSLQRQNTQQLQTNLQTIAALQTKITDLEKQNSNTSATHSAEIARLQNQIQALTQVNSNIQQQSANNSGSSSQQIAALQQQLQELTRQNNSLQQQSGSISKPSITIWAVIVGVAHYVKPSSRLNYCDDDAYKMYGFFKSPEGGAVPESRIKLLIDEDATGDNIKNALSAFSKKAGKDDILMFYYSGHGTPNNLLGRDYSERSSGFVSHQFVKEQLENSAAKFTYCILDACHSGNVINNTKSVKALEQESNFYDALKSTNKGGVFIVSSKGVETSLETSGNRQGLFSYYFIKALKGAADYNTDQIISITEAFDYTRKKVISYSSSAQNPLISGNYNHNMPLAFVR